MASVLVGVVFAGVNLEEDGLEWGFEDVEVESRDWIDVKGS